MNEEEKINDVTGGVTEHSDEVAAIDQPVEKEKSNSDRTTIGEQESSFTCADFDIGDNMVTSLEEVFDCRPIRRRPMKRPRIEIRLPKPTDDDDDNNNNKNNNKLIGTLLQDTNFMPPSWRHQLILDPHVESELEFFSETHEDQDPDVQTFLKALSKNNLKLDLDQLKQAEETGRREIGDIVSAQLKEKQASADRNIDRLRTKASMEQQKDLQRLLLMYNDKAASNQRKIDQGIKLLNNRHAQEMHKAASQHRQQCQQRGIMSEQMVNAEWQQRVSQRFQIKHQRQLQEFQAKGDEVKKKCEQDYAREREKRAQHHEKRKRDMELGMEKVISRMLSNFQQQHQRYLSRFMQGLQKRKDEILAQLYALDGREPPKEKQTSSERALDQVTKEDGKNVDLKLPVNISSTTLPGGEPDRGQRGAALRHTHRKAIMGAIPKQLGVEIHNEGIWLSILSVQDGKEGENVSKTVKPEKNESSKTEFLPWGAKAREVLHAIICGEVPMDYGFDRFDFGDVIATQGGYIRCVITDLRTGDSTASNLRAVSMVAQEDEIIRDLEKKAQVLAESIVVSEKNMKEAENADKEAAIHAEQASKDVEKAKTLLLEFRSKFGKFFGPDGQPVPSTNASDKQKLIQASIRYKTNLETAYTKEKAAQKASLEAKVLSQKVQSILKQTQKAAVTATALCKKRKMAKDLSQLGKFNKAKFSEASCSERAATRIADTIAALRRTADCRREQLNQKRSSTASSTWVQALPGVSGPLKKSLWHKMHRRRANILLRPCPDFQLHELKTSIRAHMVAHSKETAVALNETEAADAELKAEQLFLLATHPNAPASGQLPSVPPVSSYEPWAEPGWQLNLDVPKDSRPRGLLPREPVFSVFQGSYEECCSTVGRQLASFLEPAHLIALSAPLSAVTQAISLAEVNPVITSKITVAENDPLNISNVSMEGGYSFQLKSVNKSSSQSRRKPNADPDSKDVKELSLKKATLPLPSVGAANISQAPSPGVTGTSSSLSTTAQNAAKPALVRRISSKGLNKPPPVNQRVPSAKHLEVAPNLTAESPPTKGSGVQQQMLAARQQQQQSLLAQQQAAALSAYGQMNVAPQQQQQQQQPTQSQIQLQPQQFHQQLLPTHAQPYSPQFHQRQMAQMHMMQQRYPQQMGFFPTMQQTGARQSSFTTNNPQPMQQMQTPSRTVPQNPNQRRTSQQNSDEQNDPLFMLSEMNPGAGR